MRVGALSPRPIDVRFVAATNRDLESEVLRGTFRADLYYRVNPFAIRLPSLRERPVDIPVLAQRFLVRYCAANGMPVDAKVFSKEALDRLAAYPWPGNIRELESTVSRAALSAPGRTIRGADTEFLHTASAPVEAQRERLPSLRETERAHIVRVLDSVGWNKKEAAEILEVSRGTLYRKIGEYGLEPARTAVR